jgi:hypothetical protein
MISESPKSKKRSQEDCCPGGPAEGRKRIPTGLGLSDEPRFASDLYPTGIAKDVAGEPRAYASPACSMPEIEDAKTIRRRRKRLASAPTADDTDARASLI